MAKPRITPVAPTASQTRTLAAWIGHQTTLDVLSIEWHRIESPATRSAKARNYCCAVIRARGRVQGAPNAQFHGTCAQSGRVYIQLGRVWVNLDYVS